MISNRRRSVVVVSTAAVLAGLGGGALGFAIHSAEASPAPRTHYSSCSPCEPGSDHNAGPAGDASRRAYDACPPGYAGHPRDTRSPGYAHQADSIR